MPTTQTLIEDALTTFLSRSGPCTMEEAVKSLHIYDWSEVFSAVDDMSRDGRLVLRRPSSSVYQLSLSSVRPPEKKASKKAVAVPFCVGCGYVCDEIEPEDGASPWVPVHRYLKKYRLSWIELNRHDGFCPACARVQACGRRSTDARQPQSV